MRSELKTELAKAIESQTLYDFIVQNYWELSKEELKDIAKELVCVAFPSNYLDDPEIKEQSESKAKELMENVKEFTTLLED